jgi:hypothetical protein
MKLSVEKDKNPPKVPLHCMNLCNFNLNYCAQVTNCHNLGVSDLAINRL